MLASVIELEKLKPLAQQKINELNSRKSYQQSGRENFRSNFTIDFSPVKKQTTASYDQIKVKFIREIKCLWVIMYCFLTSHSNIVLLAEHIFTISVLSTSSEEVLYKYLYDILFMTRQSDKLQESLSPEDQGASSFLM